MATLSRFITLVPLVFCIVSAVLAALALFAGHEKGFMEDYAIARLNTSRIGYNLVDLDGITRRNVMIARQDGENEDDDNIIDDISDGADDLFGGDDEEDGGEENTEEDDGGEGEDDGDIIDDISDGAEDAWDEISGDIEDGLNDIGNAAADELAEALGLSEWYSLHVMAACQGLYKPEPTAENAGLNISYCNATAPEDAFNIEDMISLELSLGPYDLTLDDLNWPSEIQDQLDKLNDVLLAMFVLYVLGLGLSGIGVFTAGMSFVWAHKRSLVIVNLVIVGLAALCLLVGSIIVTVAVTEGIDQINDVGEEVGVEVTRGDKYLAITWAAAGLALVSTAIWMLQFCIVWRERKRTAASHHRKSNI